MKTSLVIKSLALIIPMIGFIIFLLINTGKFSSIGGGSYNLARLYYLIFVIGFLVIYETGLLINNNKENTILLLLGLALLIGHVVYAFMTIR